MKRLKSGMQTHVTYMPSPQADGKNNGHRKCKNNSLAKISSKMSSQWASAFKGVSNICLYYGSRTYTGPRRRIKQYVELGNTRPVFCIAFCHILTACPFLICQMTSASWDIKAVLHPWQLFCYSFNNKKLFLRNIASLSTV